MRYIELNPVRANRVEHPGDYRWWSYAQNAVGTADGIISPHPLYAALGDDPEARRVAYRKLFRELRECDPDVLAAIRSGTRTGTPIGTDRFRARIATSLNRRVERFPHGGDRRGKRFQRLSSTLTP